MGELITCCRAAGIQKTSWANRFLHASTFRNQNNLRIVAGIGRVLHSSPLWCLALANGDERRHIGTRLRVHKTPVGGCWDRSRPAHNAWRKRKMSGSRRPSCVSIPCDGTSGRWQEFEWIHRRPTKGKTPVKAHLSRFGRLNSGGLWIARCFVFYEFNTFKRKVICIYMHIGAYIPILFCKNYWVFIAYPWIVLAPPMLHLGITTAACLDFPALTTINTTAKTPNEIALLPWLLSNAIVTWVPRKQTKGLLGTP